MLGSDWTLGDERFQDEVSYVQDIASDELPVQISGVQKKQIGPKPVIFYVVKSGSCDVVERRYSDFAWLRDAFKALYCGMLLPPMPRKELLQTDALVETRKVGLESYLKSLLRNPYLRHDALLKQFLCAQGEKWATLRDRSADNVAANEVFRSPGSRRWNVLIESFSVDPDTPTMPTMTKLKDEAERLMSITAAAAGAAEAMLGNLEQNQHVWRTISGLFKQDNKLSQRKYVVKYLPALKEATVNLRLVNVAATIGRLPGLTAQEAEGVRMLARTLREDADYIHCFIEVLAGYFQTANRYREKRAHHDKTQREMEAHKEQLRYDQSAKLEPVVKRLNAECKQIKERVHFHAKAVLYSEAGRYSQRRFARLRLNLHKFAMLKCTSEQAAAEMWQDVLDLLGADTDTMAAAGMEHLDKRTDLDPIPYNAPVSMFQKPRPAGQATQSLDDDGEEEEEDIGLLQNAMAAYYGAPGDSDEGSSSEDGDGSGSEGGDGDGGDLVDLL